MITEIFKILLIEYGTILNIKYLIKSKTYKFKYSQSN